MTLQNYSRYEITINGDTMYVKNIQTGNRIQAVSDRYHALRKYILIDDNGNKHSVSELRIAWALGNGVALHKIPKSVRFYGSVSNPVIGKREEKMTTDNDVINRIMELEHALDMMKYAYYSKDYSRFVEFAYNNKRTAIVVTSKRIGVSIARLEDFWDDGLEIFLDSVKEMKFTSLKPIMSYLCTCLKYGYVRNKDRSLPVIDAVLSDNPIPRKHK